MRLIGGLYKGTTLLQPRNKLTRPLKDITKEAIFNLLLHSNKINLQFDNISVLDIFSGTGSFGLECISRGANKVTFIENYKPIISILEKNILKLNVSKKCSIIKLDIKYFLQNTSFFDNYDFIFLDPPFKFENITELLIQMINKKLIKKNTLLTIHRHKKTFDNFTNHLKIIDERIYGKSKISFLKLT
tara:strand:+ start:330 stop:893 length:564 start_codon:yes stop_codon:yes gene_type:complete